jgi:hypothetical protein
MDKVLVLLNFDAKPADLSLAGVGVKKLGQLIASNRATASTSGVHQDPPGVFVGEVE